MTENLPQTTEEKLTSKYEKFKKYLRANPHTAWYLVCVVAMFFFGLSLGRQTAPPKNGQPITSINSSKKTDLQEAGLANPPPPPTTITATNPTEGQVAGQGTVDQTNCPVKGNISSKSKIYHVKGGAFYDRTNAEVCFNTEAEALSAGFRKSSR